MEVSKIVSNLTKSPRYRSRVEHIEVLPFKGAVYGEPQKPLAQPLKDYLKRKNMRLYKHQSQAIDLLRDGKNVIITTPTASGKTLAFNLPVFERLLWDKKATAFYLYPTKALANDQLKVVKEIEDSTYLNLCASLYDGDTAPDIKRWIRKTSRLVISNPYELHQILDWHHLWGRFYTDLKYIVVDEAHHYRGIFGSNVAFVLRRLRRICAQYGSEPQFVISSATLANPIEFAEKLTGLKFELVDFDGAPRGRKFFILYNPYWNGVGELSTHQESRDLFVYYVKKGLQTLCFTVSRKMAELIAMWSRNKFREMGSYLAQRITAYRAGYRPKERREIEEGLKSGALRGVTCTNALELGIDIGSLDSIIISGYPGTIISTWQQAGRAGRGTDDAMVTLVAFQDPLNQFIMKHPKNFFGRPHEHAIIDLSNPKILSGHILCAAKESPLNKDELKEYFGDGSSEIGRILEKDCKLTETSLGLRYAGYGRPIDQISLENISIDHFTVMHNKNILETMDRIHAYKEAHEGAVLLHQGLTYLVKKMDLTNRLVEVERQDLTYHTEPIQNVDIRVSQKLTHRRIGSFIVNFGIVEVKETIVGYKTMEYDEVKERKPLNLPSIRFRTEGLWITFGEKIKKRVEKHSLNFFGGLHGIEHALIAMMPFHVMCDRRDIGGVSTPTHPDTEAPTVFIYDGFEGGIGLTEKAVHLFEKILETTYQLVKDCPCETGCPSCIYSPKCGNENEPLDKKATILLLKYLF